MLFEEPLRLLLRASPLALIVVGKKQAERGLERNLAGLLNEAKRLFGDEALGLLARFGKFQDADAADGVALATAEHDHEGLGTASRDAHAKRAVRVPNCRLSSVRCLE